MASSESFRPTLPWRALQLLVQQARAAHDRGDVAELAQIEDEVTAIACMGAWCPR